MLIMEIRIVLYFLISASKLNISFSLHILPALLINLVANYESNQESVLWVDLSIATSDNLVDCILNLF